MKIKVNDKVLYDESIYTVAAIIYATIYLRISYDSDSYDYDISEVYKKYNEKGLTIIGISLDRVKDSWSEAIRKYNLNVWPQILSSETNEKDEKENNLSYLYNCDAIPFYVLIDKEGKVVAKWEHIGDVQLKELDMLIK